jgi:hypothetical protein
MRLSKLGVAFALFYVLPTLVCVAWSLAPGDSKGSFVLLQLPVALQLAALHEMGFGELSSMSWVEAYIFLATPVVVILYIAGRSIGRMYRGFRPKAV